MELKITCIAGDGIGPEIVAEAKKVLDRIAQKYGHTMNYTDILMGGGRCGGKGGRRSADGFHRRGYHQVSLV